MTAEAADRLATIELANIREFQDELSVSHAKSLALTINISVENVKFRVPLTDKELASLHNPFNGPGATGPRAHAEILRLRQLLKKE